MIARVGFRWYAFAIFSLAVVSIATIVLTNWFGPPPALPILSLELSGSGPGNILITSLIIFLISLIFNGEELAWRGFALPRLQQQFGPVLGSIILGVLWALWHLPGYLGGWMGALNAVTLLALVIGGVAFSLIATWVYNNTNRSILLMILLHASSNAAIAVGTRVIPTPTLFRTLCSARCMAFWVRGCCGVRPGKSQGRERELFQYSRKPSSNVGGRMV